VIVFKVLYSKRLRGQGDRSGVAGVLWK
jgi:hypothetical protein